jgi:hypothetical protein
VTGGDEFFRTRMGRMYYEVTMPKIADELARMNATLEALVAEIRASNGRLTPTTRDSQTR